MDTVISILTAWKDLIISVFSSQPLAGATVSIVAAAIYFLLHTQYRKGRVASNAFWVLFGWAIAVPIVGLVFDIGGEIYAAVKHVLGFVWAAAASFYGIYARHPILVLVVVAAALGAYVVWGLLRPQSGPSRPLRVVILIVVVTAVVHLLSPIVDLFGVAASPPSGQAPASAVAPPFPAAASTTAPPPAASESASAASSGALRP
jgi:hypothetical protein